MKLELKQKAKDLRLQGLSISQIAKELQVSKSSVSIWVRDIKLSTEQIQKLREQNPSINKQLNGAQKRSNDAKLIRINYQNCGRLQAKKQDLLHQAGCLLYWAEGTKTRNQCRFTNSDAEMMKLFLRFIRKFYSHLENKITLTINYYTNNGLSGSDIKKYWLNTLNLYESSLRKCQENNHPRSATNSIKHNKLPYGIACITICSSELIQNIYGAIQEYAGFNNDYMLK